MAAFRLLSCHCDQSFADDSEVPRRFRRIENAVAALIPSAARDLKGKVEDDSKIWECGAHDDIAGGAKQLSEVGVGHCDLKRISRIDETIRYDPLATRQRWPDNTAHMIKSRSTYQQQLLCRGELAVGVR